MVGMVSREVECPLCGAKHALVLPDFYLDSDTVCDDCWEALWPLTEAELAEAVEKQVQTRANLKRQPSPETVRFLVDGLLAQRQRWGSLARLMKARQGKLFPGDLSSQ